MLRTKLLVDGAADAEDRVEAGPGLEDAEPRPHQRLGEVLGGGLAVAAGDADHHRAQAGQLAAGSDAVAPVDRRLDRHEAQVGGHGQEGRGVNGDGGNDEDRQAWHVRGRDREARIDEPRGEPTAGDEHDRCQRDRHGQEASRPAGVDERFLPRGPFGSAHRGHDCRDRGEQRGGQGGRLGRTRPAVELRDDSDGVDERDPGMDQAALRRPQPAGEAQVGVVVLLEGVETRDQAQQRQHQPGGGGEGQDGENEGIRRLDQVQLNLISHRGTPARPGGTARADPGTRSGRPT